jgi:hypothetical protein
MPAIPVNAASSVSGVPDASAMAPGLLAAVMLMNSGDVDVDARKISLGNIGNAASLGFSGLGILNGLNTLFGRDVSEEINEIVARQSAGDADARAISLSNIGNAASLGFSGLGILNGLNTLFGRDISDDISAEIMAELLAMDAASSNDLDARKLSLGTIANGASLGALGLSILGPLFGIGGERRELADDLEARKFSLGNAATIAGLGLSANNIINQLTDLFNRSEDPQAREVIDELEARINLGQVANIAGLGSAGLGIFNGLNGLFGRDLSEAEMEARRLSLGNIANIAGLGSAGLGIINGLNGLFSRELSESEMEARRVSLGTIANGATLGSLGLSLLGGLFGGGERRDLSDDAILAQLFGANSPLASLD